MYKIVFNSTQLGEKELENNPDNIKEIDSYFVRSEKYHSVSQRIEDVSFNWVFDGAEYIRNIMKAYGSGAVVNVVIYYTGNQLDYEQFYTGKLDLTSFIDSLTSVECRVVNSDVEQKVWNNIETDYKVYLPSNLNIKQRNNEYAADYTLFDPNELTTLKGVSRVQTTTVNSSKLYVLYAKLSEGDRSKYNNNVIGFSEDINYNDEAPFLNILVNKIYQNNSQNSNVYFDFPSFGIYLYDVSAADPSTTVRLNLVAQVITSSGTGGGTLTIGHTSIFEQGSGSPYLTVTMTPITSNSLYLVAGESMVLYIECEQIGVFSQPTVTFKVNSTIDISLNVKEYKTDTRHRSISIPRALNRLIYATINNESPTTDPTYNYLDSELFREGTRYGRTYITSGNELRRAITPNVDGSMTTNIAEIFDALNVPFCCGLGLTKEGDNVKMKLDHRSEFYKPKVVLSLGEVKDLTIEFAPEYLFNILNIDYPSVDNKDFSNGIYEYLTKYAYTTPLSHVDNSLENSSSYKVDATSIEELRTNQVTENSDSQTDDSTNFMIRCVIDDDLVYSSNGSEFGSISQTGLQNNTQLFNVDMFAPITFRFWAWWILAGLEFNENSENIVIQKSEQNSDVSITIDGITCDTNNVTIAKLKELAGLNPFAKGQGALFEPYKYTFTAPMTVLKINQFDANRHNAIEFTNNGVTYYGYALKIPALPKREGEFELLKLNKRAESYD